MPMTDVISDVTIHVVFPGHFLSAPRERTNKALLFYLRWESLFAGLLLMHFGLFVPFDVLIQILAGFQGDLADLAVVRVFVRFLVAAL